MSASSRPIITDFNVIEQDKENIQVLSKGRSAAALSKTFSMPLQDKRQVLNNQRKKFEEALQDTSQLDDPIEPYLAYLQWTHDHFPMGSNVESGLISILERCTHDFRDDEYYKNEIRYLKVWLEYIKHSDSPRDIFIYLFKKKIGVHLALFYEEFSKYLESQNNFDQAEEILIQGIQQKARPVKRLSESYESFKIRKNMNLQNPIVTHGSSGGIRDGRHVLGVISDTAPVSRPTTSIQAQTSIAPNKNKLSIFKDSMDQGTDANLLNDNPGIWNNLEKMQSRKKENVLKPTSWQGEVLIQDKNAAQLSNAKASTSKIMVFRDDSLQFPVTKTIHNPGKKSDKFNLNFDLLYPDNNEIFCPLEILSLSLGVYHKQRNMKKRKRERSPSPKGTPLKSNNQLHDKLQASPTLTFFSKQASKEINQMINQPLLHDYQTDNYDETNATDGGLSDFVTETITKPLLADRSKDVEESQNDEDIFTESPSKKVFKVADSADMNDELKSNSRLSLNRPLLTSIPEIKESPNPRQNDDILESLMSSPFQDRVRIDDMTVMPPPRPDSVLINPLVNKYKQDLLDKVSLADYSDFRKYNYSMNKLPVFKKLFKANRASLPLSVVGNRDTILELGDDLFCIKKELGEGGYATVYLAEKSNGEYNAIKLERPANVWEFYILKQIGLRTSNSSFIYTDSLHAFNDEGYLVLKYFKQGTILDLINLAKSRGSGVLEESVAIFICYELLSKIEVLHEIGIIHGDLKPDNCMLNFTSSSGDLQLNPSNSSIVLIDYGRAVDMTILPSNVKFTCDWKTDNQDCPQMAKGEPWTYECDYYGIASIMHTILFGQYIDVKELSNGKYTLARSLKRYWNKELWSDVFDTLLNPKSHGILPINDKINLLRLSLKNWLCINAKNTHFKGLIKSYEEDLNQIHKRPGKSYS